MLVKELVGRLNSYNMDAQVQFDDGDSIEIEIVDNEDEVITDNGNAKAIIMRIVKKSQMISDIIPTPPSGESN